MKSLDYRIGKYLRKKKQNQNLNISSSSNSIEETFESQITNKIYSTKILYNEFTIETNIKDKVDLKEKFKILVEKEKIFLHCLLKISEEGRSSKKIFDCSNLEFEAEEMKFHDAIGRVVHQLMHNKIKLNNPCMYYKNLNSSCKISHENIDKLINKEKTTNKKLEFIAIKSIIISISSFTSELIKNYFVYLKNRINIFNFEEEDLNYVLNCEIFSHMYEDYEVILSICTIIERDFSKSLNWFREKYQMNFYLYDLFTDIFWNAIFHKKQFCNAFLQNYNCEKIDKNTQEVFEQIISNLFELNIPLKRQISELLGIKNKVEDDEKYDLLSLMISEKKLNNNFYFCDNNKEYLNINNIISKIKSSNQEKEIETFININEENINELANLENIKYGYEQIKEDIKIIKNNIITKEKENNDIKEIKKLKTNDTTTLSNNSINISNQSSLNENNNNNITLENKTIDEIFDYINSDSNEKSKNKRKHKKKK